MGVFDRIKKIFKKEEQRTLPDPDMTEQLITINTLEAILNDKDMYKKFTKFEKNQETFGVGLSKEDYEKALLDYVSYNSKKNNILDKKQAKRFNSLTKGQYTRLTEEKKEKNIGNLTYEILSSKENMNRFLAEDMDQITNSGFAYEDIQNNIERTLKTDKDFMSEDEKDIAEKLLSIGDVKRNGQHARMYNINKEFEERIFENIPEDLDDHEMARAIYIELNKRVKYDQNYLYGNGTLDDNFVEKLYNKNIEEITLENNELICKGWSELYGHLLKKKNIDSYIMGKSKHKYINLIADGQVIKADATNTAVGEDKTSMNDLVRAKLNIPPAGFETKGKDFEELDKKLLTDDNTFEIKDEILEKLNKIDDYSLEENTKELTYSEKKEKLMKLMSTLNKNSEQLDTLEKYRYYQNYLKIIDKSNNGIISKMNSNLFKEVEGNHEIIPVIVLKDKEQVLDEKNQHITKEKLEYLVLDGEENTNCYSREEMLDRIGTGDYVMKNILGEKERYKKKPEVEKPTKESMEVTAEIPVVTDKMLSKQNGGEDYESR